MSQKRGKYTEDYKQYAVWLVTRQGQAVASTARNLGVSPATLRRWKRELGAVEAPAHQEPEKSAAEQQQILNSLEAKLTRLQQVVAASFAETAKLQRAAVAQREQLAGIQERLAAVEKMEDKLLDACHKAYARLMALEGERTIPEVELPTLVAERDAGQTFEPVVVDNDEPGKRPKRGLALGSVFAALLLLLVVATQRIWTDGTLSLQWLESTVPSDSDRLSEAKPRTFVENGDKLISPVVPAPEELATEETVAVAALELEEKTSNDATGSDHVPVSASVAWPDGVTQEGAEVLPPMAMLVSREKAEQRYGVQVGAYREPANLARTLRQMQELGFMPVITVRTGSAASLTGVVVGDFAERDDACDIECPLNEMGWETWVRAY